MLLCLLFMLLLLMLSIWSFWKVSAFSLMEKPNFRVVAIYILIDFYENRHK